MKVDLVCIIPPPPQLLWQDSHCVRCSITWIFSSFFHFVGFFIWSNLLDLFFDPICCIFPLIQFVGFFLWSNLLGLSFKFRLLDIYFNPIGWILTLVQFVGFFLWSNLFVFFLWFKLLDLSINSILFVDQDERRSASFHGSSRSQARKTSLLKVINCFQGLQFDSLPWFSYFTIDSQIWFNFYVWLLIFVTGGFHSFVFTVYRELQRDLYLATMFNLVLIYNRSQYYLLWSSIIPF